MPAIVGFAQVISIGSSGVFHIGDVFNISPISTAKTFAGAGSFITGRGISVYNESSLTYTVDDDTMDQGIILNV
ncbi:MULTISPECIES: spore germination protein [Rossellomorea]|jgi:spore germination protein PA|uniref:Spore germination protein n=2 Tax=Rossellomorea marisflavi TaxID=189381 RepID=A0A0J5T9K5_9BACI|nr:spore germination protein [Rossellomorea marisflavi]KQU60691.1 spore gernimation protein GerPA [Bacillus sp. Leaf406]MBV6682908.1 spore germination protein [Bacillus sp. JRC01]VXB26588.1 spore germination protein [Bacillus sp. 349Y]KMK96830.1 spore gernimation protein GerPA [Rossellomorea marisflavi]KML06126.1 spore gernimation protein GerPA [Rossellomorea marisflavi]